LYGKSPLPLPFPPWTPTAIDQRNGFPVTAIAMKDSMLSLKIDAVHGSYEGAVNREGNEIDVDKDALAIPAPLPKLLNMVYADGTSMGRFYPWA
jgi:hypothetical protein